MLFPSFKHHTFSEELRHFDFQNSLQCFKELNNSLRKIPFGSKTLDLLKNGKRALLMGVKEKHDEPCYGYWLEYRWTYPLLTRKMFSSHVPLLFTEVVEKEALVWQSPLSQLFFFVVVVVFSFSPFFRIVTGPLSYFLSFPFADIISRVQPKKTSAVGRLLLKIRRDSLVHTGSGHTGWRGRRGGKGAPRGGGRGGCVLLAGLVRGSKHLWN